MKIEVPQIMIRRYIEPKDYLDTRIGVKGHFHVVKKRRGIIVQELDFDNIIVDTGLKMFAYINGNNSRADDIRHMIYSCMLGTGTSIPVSTDTSLEAPVTSTKKAYSSQLQIEKGGSGADRYIQFSYEYGANDANGTWTEVGLFEFYSSNNMFCRMLFKDAQGNPIAVQKTSDDTLTITYTLHIRRLSDTPTTNTIKVEGVGEVTVSSIILDKFLEHYTTSTFYPNYVPTVKYVRLGTGSGEILPTRIACYNPINIEPTLYQTVNYSSSTPFSREFVYEWPASLVGNISEATIVTGYSSSNDAPDIYMQFSPVIPKNDTTKKIRLRPRITFARAS